MRVPPAYAPRCFRLVLLLALLLPLLQIGAAVHAISHLADTQRSDLAHLDDHAGCALCAAYAITGSAIPGAAPGMPALAVMPASIQPRACSDQTPAPCCYLARAPPIRHFS